VEEDSYPDQTILAALTMTHAHNTSGRIRSNMSANLFISPPMTIVSPMRLDPQ
jgi:hypothetical protein